MATISRIPGSTAFVVASSSSESLPIGGAPDWTSLRLQVFVPSAWSGALAIQTRIPGVGAPWSADVAILDNNTGTTASITAAGEYLIDCADVEVQLVHTWTSGAVSIGVKPGTV